MTAPGEKTMPQATDSQIAMWRGAIALTWVDREMHEAEKARLLQYFKDNIYLTDSQRAQLAADLDRPISVQDVWGAITDTQDRAHLIDIAPTLFAMHGAPTPAEKAVYDKMMADQMATIDTKALEEEFEEIRAHIPVERADDEALYRSEFHHWGPLDNLVYHLNKMIGNDV
jgi:arylsulfatase A-like enzyme